MKDIFPLYNIGHFINQPSNLTDFEILRFNNMEVPRVDNFHKHTFYEILWTEKGNSRQIIDYKEFEVNPNSLFLISPNQVHFFAEWRHLMGGTIFFTEDFYLLNRNDKDTLFELTFLDNFYSNPCIEFTDKEFVNILNFIGEIEKEQKRIDRNPSIIQAYLHILLTQVQRHVDKTSSIINNKRHLILFKKFKKILEEHFDQNNTAVFYANELNITQHHLNLVCRKITNNTATQIIRARSVLEAKRFLTFTDKTILEIAYTLNYTDSSYFAKTFKLFTNKTPQDFRTEMSEKYRRRLLLS